MDWRMVGIVIVVVCVASLVYTEVQKRLIFSKYRALFERQDFAGCVKLLDRPLSKLLFPRYNQLYMRLNAQMCLDNPQECRRIVDEMLGLRTSDEQRVVLLLRAFNLFVEQEDYDRAGGLLQEIREKAPAEASAECEQTYDIYAKGSYQYIDEMERALEGADPAQQARLCYLLSLQYESKGDERRAAEYLSRVRDAFGPAAAGRGL